MHLNAHKSRGLNPIRILIVVCERSEEEIRRILQKHAPRRLEEEGIIRFLIIKNNFRRFKEANSLKINKIAPKNTAARVILLDQIEHNEKWGEGADLRSRNVFKDFRSFNDSLPAILSQAGLDWRTFAVNRLSAWHHSVIDSRFIADWIGQFSQLGVTWIGEYIIRTLDFWHPERIFTAFDLSENRLEGYDCICLKRQQPGKSADFLANLLRKRLSTFKHNIPIEDFVDVFQNHSSKMPKRILFIEDSLLTGTEMTNFLSGLIGLPKNKRPWRVNPASDIDALLSSEIEFYFPVSTSLGKNRFRQFLKEKGFVRAKLETYEDGFLEVLTNAGQDAFTAGSFYHSIYNNCPAEPTLFIERTAFRGPWKHDSQRLQIEEFCRVVGGQLFKEYLTKQGWTWEQYKIELSCFGMHGLGLNLAFCHSVPKSSIPLLWASGRVKFNNSTLHWIPLFQNASI